MMFFINIVEYIYIYIHGGLAAAKCHGTLDVTRKCQAFKPSLKN